LRRIQPGNIPRLDEVVIEPVVFLFALAIALAAALLLAVASTVWSQRIDLMSSIRKGARTQAGGSGGRLRGALVAVQVAVTLMLVVGAGLLGRSMLELLDQDAGFRTEGLLVMSMPWAGPSDADTQLRQVQVFDELIERIGAMPGVRKAGGINRIPLQGSYANGMFLKMFDGDEFRTFDDWEIAMRDEARVGYAEFRVADGAYFDVIDIPLMRGRVFDDRDTPDSPHVAVISQSLAREYWPDQDPIGRRIQFGNMDGDLTPYTVVGIVGDILERGLDREARGTFYGCYRQRPRAVAGFSVVIDPEGSIVPIQQAARAGLRELDPALPAQFRIMDSIYVGSFADRSFNLLLVGIFGTVGLILATLGILSVTSYDVAQRRRDIGIRIALGAGPGQVFRLVMGRGLGQLLTGVVAGTLGALLLTRVMQGLVFGVSTADPITYLVALVVIVGSSLVASFLPTRRALRIDPIRAVQAE
jgi:predicted permease